MIIFMARDPQSMAFNDFVSVTLASLAEFSNGVNYGKEAMGSGLGIINVKDIFKS
jgi:hypothetical protein